MGIDSKTLPPEVAARLGLSSAKPRAARGAVMHKNRHRLEDKFADWLMLRGITMQREGLLVPGRKFRIDFYHEPTKTAVEIQGGTFARGTMGHSSASGITRDAEKLALLQDAGWHVVLLTEMLMRKQDFMDRLESRLKGG